MTFQNDQCDFCGRVFDPMGNDLKQMVGDNYWCGQCDISHLTADAYRTEIDRKAAAFDELVVMMNKLERHYWNNLWGNHGLNSRALEFQRHMVFLNYVDGLRLIKAKFGLSG